MKLELRGGEADADAVGADEVVVAEGDHKVREPDHGLALAAAGVLSLGALGYLSDVLCYFCDFAPCLAAVVLVTRIKEGD